MANDHLDRLRYIISSTHLRILRNAPRRIIVLDKDVSLDLLHGAQHQFFRDYSRAITGLTARGHEIKSRSFEEADLLILKIMHVQITGPRRMSIIAAARLMVDEGKARMLGTKESAVERLRKRYTRTYGKKSRR